MTNAVDSEPDRSAVLEGLVQRLADKRTRNDAIRSLVGGLTATELRRVTELPADTFAALVAGVRDPHPQVRWWCIQLLDHVADERAIEAVAAALDDAVPRVRRNAAHAMGCLACKPTAPPTIADALLAKLAEVAANDPNEKVRHEAAWALACRGDPGEQRLFRRQGPQLL